MYYFLIMFITNTGEIYFTFTLLVLLHVYLAVFTCKKITYSYTDEGCELFPCSQEMCALCIGFSAGRLNL